MTEKDTRIAAIPDGWKLVPIEPTREMQERALYANERGDIRVNEVREIYRAMLAASPTSPSNGEGADEGNGGPLRDGWQLSIGPGHAGYGAYAHMTEYPDEGAVCLATFDPNEYPEAGIGDMRNSSEPASRAALDPGSEGERKTKGLSADEWDEAQRICDLPDVDLAVRDFVNDQTDTNATSIVREVLRARAASPSAGDAPTNLHADAMRYRWLREQGGISMGEVVPTDPVAMDALIDTLIASNANKENRNGT